jgi:hypothetical protein
MCVYVPFFLKKRTESTLSPMAESSQCFIILHMQKQRTAEWEREGLLLRLWYKILWRAGGVLCEQSYNVRIYQYIVRAYNSRICIFSTNCVSALFMFSIPHFFVDLNSFIV